MPEPTTPTLHHKPTKAELEAKIKADEAAIDAATPPATPPTPETPPATPVVPPVTPETPPATPPTPETPPAGEGTPPETPPATPPGDQGKSGIDYRKRYADSSREAARISGENKEIKGAIAEAANIPEPTAEELTTEFPEWEEMTPTEQRLAKDSLLNKKRFELLHTATSKITKADEWNDKVKGFVADPAVLTDNPILEGKEEEFESFATAPERRNMDLPTLILAFEGEVAKNKPAPQKGQMFPQGQGGGAAPIPKPDDGKISLAEGEALKKSDYKKYVELLKAKKIRDE